MFPGLGDPVPDRVGTNVPARLRNLRLWVRIALSAVTCAVFLLHAAGRAPMGFLDRTESYLYDLRVRLAMPGGIDPRVVIVDIDERSLAAEGQWPWRRDKLATLLDHLFDDYEVRVVGFDVVFPEPDDATALQLLDEAARGTWGNDPELRQFVAEARPRYATDEAFAGALVARNVVLGALFKPRVAPGEPARLGALPPPVALAGGDVSRVGWFSPAGYTGNLAAFTDNAMAGGFFDTPVIDDDGKVRRVPLFQRFDGQLYESLALAVTRIALEFPPLALAFARDDGRYARLEYLRLGDRAIPVDAEGAVLLPFRGGVGSFPYVPATEVLNGRAPAELLRDRIVLIGTSAPGLVDIRPTPVSKEYVGVEAHANLVAAMLDGAIRFQPAWAPRIEMAGLVILALLTGLWFPSLPPLASMGALLGTGAAVAGLNWLAWDRLGLWLPLASLLTFLAVAALLQLTYGYFVETRRKRRLSRLFGQYVPPEVVSELDRTEAEISLEGESREMSVLFSDVRGFTTISEGLSPRELTRLMNEFLTPITAEIQARRGTIDKYMGDAVMAFWGAPLPDAAHARQAVEAALAMVARMEALKPEFRARGWPELNIGVGVSSGLMNVGNMGSSFRMAYTVLGDTVNLGSRLEGLTKQYGVNVIVSAATRSAVDDWVFRELDRVRVKGKQEPVAIYEPLGPGGSVPDYVKQATVRFSRALEHYRRQEWDPAEALLKVLEAEGHQKVYGLYLERIRHFRQVPPGSGWDGVFAFETK
jgi:adenylate cyclase